MGVKRGDRADLLAATATMHHHRGMSVDTAKTSYRYRVDSTPQCGPGKCSPIDVHAATRDVADLRILAIEQRFHEQHARQDDISFRWTIRDRYGLLLISAVTTPEGTTYH